MSGRTHAVETLDAALQRAVRRASVMRQGFYVVVLLVALAGQVSGAVEALGIPLAAAIPAVGALELGGIVVLANADVRRRLGERAIGSRLLSAAIAVGAVAFNWLAHSDHLLGGFFAGMSALGYLVWLTHTENQRRDRLRATGDLPPTTPAYEVGGHWLRHPFLTRRAKSMAKADPTLGLYGSLAAARAEVARQRRHTAIAKVLHRKIRSAVDPATADIALAVYDLEEIAAGLTRRADYDGLTDLIAIDLAPARLAPPTHDAASLVAGTGSATSTGGSALDSAALDDTDLGGTASGGAAADRGALNGAAFDGRALDGAALDGGADALAIGPVAAGNALGTDRSAWPGGPDRAGSGGTDPYADALAPDGTEGNSPAAPGRPARRPGGAPVSAALTEASAEFQVLAAVRRELEELRSPIGAPPDATPEPPRRRPRATTSRAVPAPARDQEDARVVANPSNEDSGRVVPAQRGQSLRRLVHTTLDRHPAADPGRDHTELVDLVTNELQLDDVERITAATYVQTWKRDVGTQTALPQQARR
ncbi:hypothetical protein [Micromonospora sp. CPCC 206061]|uniref:hypothetical protein n=1 Tax=Micromonospora sp. CPCC 206061 TaxID=3122410 RepID=UPI002FF3CD7D